jgi:hypothetical protein
MKIDIHQHLWTEQLIQALTRREELPFVRHEHGLTVLYLAGERPYVIDLTAETFARRAALVELDGLDRALVCLSSPLGIESLSRAQSLPLLEAYHEGALAFGDPFGVWGAIALDRPDPADVDDVLDRGCIGISLPAGALAGVQRLERLRPVLARLQLRGAPLLVHPGPAAAPLAGGASLGEPLWWPALTRYVAEMHAAYLAFISVGRPEHPELRIVFSMLAGLAPLHSERLASRGGPPLGELDSLLFYDTSSYGPAAIRAFTQVIDSSGGLLYGSDRPIIEPALLERPEALDWDLLADAAARMFGVAQGQSRQPIETAGQTPVVPPRAQAVR